MDPGDGEAERGAPGRRRRRRAPGPDDAAAGPGPGSRPGPGPGPATAGPTATAPGAAEPGPPGPALLDLGTADPAATTLAAFQQLLDQNPLGALIVDADARVVLHNVRATTLLGTHHEDLVNGRFRHPLTPGSTEVLRRDGDGLARVLRVECTRFDGLDRPAWSVSIADRTDSSIEPDEDHRFGSSAHDALTGLPGRELFLNHVYEAARRSHGLDDERFAVVAIDLEQFTLVNQDHGRAVGDRVLQAVAARLTSIVRPGDYVSRSGGDEFGTGLSALTHLSRSPLVGLKIDRSLVARLMTDEPSAQFVLAAVESAHAFDLPVTAIGVETAEQKTVLTRWGCDHAQGYLLARPGNAVEASRFFARDPGSLGVRPKGPLLRSSGTFVRPTI